MPIFKDKSGQTLIEVSIAIGIAGVVIVALVILATNSLRNAQETIRRTESTKLASSGVEAVTFYRNTVGFETTIFPVNDGGITCVRILAGGTLGADPPLGTECPFIEVLSIGTNLKYNRSIKITKRPSEQTYDVVSTVNWNSGGGVINDVSVARVLTNWDSY